MQKALVGLGGLLSDPACCVIKDGQLASAVEQNKLTRPHRFGEFPDEAFATALRIAAVRVEDIGCVAIARPFAAASESAAQLAFRARFPHSEIVVVDHHDAHAASAYYASGFDLADVLSIDRAGDFRSAVLYRGEANRLTKLRELYFPDSLGDLFNRTTELIGFEPRSGEHKLQWLSSTGAPAVRDVFRAIIGRNNFGWPQFERSFFDADRLLQGGFSSKFQSAVHAADKADIARSVQAAVEEAVVSMLGQATHVAIAGGLAMNALLIRALEQSFPNVFVQPAAGNAGTSLGAAFYVWHNFFQEQTRVAFETLCLGPEYCAAEVKQVLENCKLRFHFLNTEGDLISKAVDALTDNKIVAWMQGRMEFGPRALGNRSILASPLDPYSTENLNVYIKHREGFRKFAASVPEELASEFFVVGSNARFLATVGEVKPAYRDRFAAAVLNESLIRIHTVSKSDNPLYHALLTAMGKATGLPVLYNTSFNLFGDPLVCTPRDAVRSFYSSGVDALFVGSFYLEK